MTWTVKGSISNAKRKTGFLPFHIVFSTAPPSPNNKQNSCSNVTVITSVHGEIACWTDGCILGGPYSVALYCGQYNPLYWPSWTDTTNFDLSKANYPDCELDCKRNDACENTYFGQFIPPPFFFFLSWRVLRKCGPYGESHLALFGFVCFLSPFWLCSKEYCAHAWRGQATRERCSGPYIVQLSTIRQKTTYVWNIYIYI